LFTNIDKTADFTHPDLGILQKAGLLFLIADQQALQQLGDLLTPNQSPEGSTILYS
jgi:hypothetical protein